MCARPRIHFMAKCVVVLLLVAANVFLSTVPGDSQSQHHSDAALNNRRPVEATNLRTMEEENSGGGSVMQTTASKTPAAKQCLALPSELQQRWKAYPDSLTKEEVRLLLSALTPDLAPLQTMEDLLTDTGRGSEAAWELVQELRKNRIQMACANHRQSVPVQGRGRAEGRLKRGRGSTGGSNKMQGRKNKYHQYFNMTNLIREHSMDHNDQSSSSIKDEAVQIRHLEKMTAHVPVAELVMKRTSLLEHFLVDDINKYIYCYVPKVACSQWKKVMMITSRTTLKSLENITHFETHFQHGLPMLSDLEYSDTDVLMRLASYTKVLVVRHPLERLLSAYQDKLHSNAYDSSYFKTLYARPMIQAVRGVDVEDGEGLLFQEMLQYITSGAETPREFQEHWRPIQHLCHPCSIEYDFIARFSSLEEDSNRILHHLLKGGHGGPQFPPAKESRTPALLQHHLTRLDPDLVAAVNQTYALDYEMFGY